MRGAAVQSDSDDFDEDDFDGGAFDSDADENDDEEEPEDEEVGSTGVILVVTNDFRSHVGLGTIKVRMI